MGRIIASRYRQYMATVAVMAALFAAEPSTAIADATDRAQNLAASCSTIGAWIDVRSGKLLAAGAVFDSLAANPILLLGERHDAAEHHRWQLQTLAALYGRGASLVLGFEMFPRRLQPVLDRWVKGELTEKTFLEASEWRRVWGFNPELYMPLFHFARMNGIPMVALNVERSLVSRVAAEGWAAVPMSEREGVTDPAAATDGYRHHLAEVFAQKEILKAAKEDTIKHAPAPDESKIAELAAKPEFQHFLEAQLTWDRAMAEGLAAAKAAHEGRQIVGIIGAGHIEQSHGVPHQLTALGVRGSAVLLPVEAGEECAKTPADYADVVFTLRPADAEQDERPKLGVVVTASENTLQVDSVSDNSVAAAAGLRKGDRIIRAAGLEMRYPGDLTEVVSRQAPGTWLPLTIKRDGEEIELVAKFSATSGRQP